MTGQTQSEVHFTVARIGEPWKTWKFTESKLPPDQWAEVCKFVLCLEQQFPPDVVTVEAESVVVT